MSTSQMEKETPQITYCAPSPGLTEPSSSAKKKDGQINQEFGQRFECQPEYRKAYIAYLTRENINRLPRAFANFDEQTPTVESSFSVSPEPEPEPIEPPPKPKYRSPYAAPKISTRDKRVPRTPIQETYLVPDLSGSGIVRRASSIFGPKPMMKKTISPERPDSPIGQFDVILPPSMIIPPSPKRKRSKSKPVEKVTTPRERSAPSSPCHKHRSPSGKPLQRRHSPCERLSRQASLSSIDRKTSKCSAKKSVERKENISIHLQPPTPRKDKPPSISARTYKVPDERVQKVPSRRPSKDEPRSSFVVLQDNEDINNNKTNKIEKEKRWMPSWYEKWQN